MNPRTRFASMSTADPHTPQPRSSMTMIRPEEPPVKASADLVAAPGTRQKAPEPAPRRWGRDAGRRARCVPDGSVGHGYSRSLAEQPKCVLTSGKTGQVGMLRSFPS